VGSADSEGVGTTGRPASHTAPNTGEHGTSPRLRRFGGVTLGALVVDIVDQLLPVNPDLAPVVESAFRTLGFGVILYSLSVE
jgi:hypothetical protein